MWRLACIFLIGCVGNAPGAAVDGLVFEGEWDVDLVYRALEHTETTLNENGVEINLAQFLQENNVRVYLVNPDSPQLLFGGKYAKGTTRGNIIYVSNNYECFRYEILAHEILHLVGRSVMTIEQSINHQHWFFIDYACYEDIFPSDTVEGQIYQKLSDDFCPVVDVDLITCMP